MTGSSLIPIVVPIMAFVAMFVWLGLVFYADSHPGWKPRRESGRPGADGAPEARSLGAAAKTALAGPGAGVSTTDPGHGRAA